MNANTVYLHIRLIFFIVSVYCLNLRKEIAAKMIEAITENKNVIKVYKMKENVLIFIKFIFWL